MQNFSLKSALALTASAAMLSTLLATPAYAQSSDDAVQDEIITIGTRRAARSAADTPAPVDVISGVEFTNQASNDLQDLLRTSVPSYNVNAQPISDAATIIRPANLRGLSPDNTLVLLNGKRRHRGSVIAFLGGGISDGSQGTDISVFPALALKQVEVLRDGASSQYGSDAIAGVMNFQLKDADEGGTVEAVYGSTYGGDGDNYRVSGNVGFSLGETGFINITGEYGETDGTVRSVQRADVAALVAAGNTAAASNIGINTYTDEVSQYWGSPDVTDNMKLFVNLGGDISDDVELYAFGNYAERRAEGGFFYRNPTNRPGVYAGPRVNPANGDGLTLQNDQGTDDTSDDIYVDGGGTTFLFGATSASVLVGDETGAGTCPAGIPLTGTDNLIPDPTILASISAGGALDADCFSFIETIPGGFVPRFGGNNKDYSMAAGLRGELENGLGWDVSATAGVSDTDFFINNTVNASLGSKSPRDFVPGAYKQSEITLNADFTYGLPVSGWASDLGIAFGAEWRQETFSITAGDPASYAVDALPGAAFNPNLSAQGFNPNSNGFSGFRNSTSDKQSNIGIYVDLEADVTDSLTLQTAARYEDHDSFGDTLNYKVAGLYKLTDDIRLRATYSTGFHAPTAGQANVFNVTTQQSNGILADEATLPLTTNAAQLGADYLVGQGFTRPTLNAEKAKNISAGVAFTTGDISWTIDYFNIKVDDRIATVDNIAFSDVLNDLGTDSMGMTIAGYNNTNITTSLDSLGTLGIINRADFVGTESLSSFKFFSNNFGTKTQGLDVIARMPLNLGAGSTNATFAMNYTDTEVTNSGNVSPISAGRISALEDSLPNVKGNFTVTHQQGMFRGLVRANYFGGWEDTQNGTGKVSGEFLFDAEVGAEVYEGMELILGVQNLLDNYPDINPSATGLGQKYPEQSPMGFNGGQYYVKARYTF